MGTDFSPLLGRAESLKASPLSQQVPNAKPHRHRHRSRGVRFPIQKVVKVSFFLRPFPRIEKAKQEPSHFLPGVQCSRWTEVINAHVIRLAEKTYHIAQKTVLQYLQSKYLQVCQQNLKTNFQKYYQEKTQNSGL